ncbi:MAG: HIT family protein [Defluviitaleaceae bacterium]|nr:HIT family protein [Defluviitaleaceae bacterium]
MSNCIFCKIIAGEIPCFKIYEDENLLAILDRFPSATGHTLIIPKRHAADIFELNDAEAAGILPLAKRIAEKIRTELTPDGVNIVQNNGRAAGQEIFHYHMHIVPRNKNDGLKFNNPPTDPPLNELAKTAEKLKLSE